MGTGIRGVEGAGRFRLGARILAIADAYDSMTHPHTQRPPMRPALAMNEIERCSGTVRSGNCRRARRGVRRSSSRGSDLMPLYEYSCKACAHQFEVLVRNGDRPECPACHGSELERRFSVFAAHTGAAPTRTRG